jgi:hypothetical protein
MRAVFRWTLRVTAFLAGMIGTGVAHLRYSLVWRIDGFIVLGVVGLLVLCLLMRCRLREGTAAYFVSLLAGIILAVGALFYGWLATSLSMLGVAVLFGLLWAKGSLPAPILRVIRFAIVVVICQWSIFAADHLAIGGRVFAFKWLHLDHPVFGPSEPLLVERDSRCAIYLYDMSRCVWTDYQAVIWGWSMFPKIVDLGDEKPVGILANHSKIQGAIR